jgi:hypothetical protein
VFNKINVPSESPHQVIKRETESAINKINAKPLSKNKFVAFWQKMGRGIAKAGVKVRGGLRHAKAWLKESPVGQLVNSGIKIGLSAIPHPAA